MAAAYTREEFLAVYRELRDELVATVPAQLGVDAASPVAQEAAAHVRELIEYNVPGGKLIRGLTVVHTCVRGARVSRVRRKGRAYAAARHSAASRPSAAQRLRGT